MCRRQVRACDGGRWIFGLTSSGGVRKQTEPCFVMAWNCSQCQACLLLPLQQPCRASTKPISGSACVGRLQGSTCAPATAIVCAMLSMGSPGQAFLTELRTVHVSKSAMCGFPSSACAPCWKTALEQAAWGTAFRNALNQHVPLLLSLLLN